ncbi:hypothetical protein NECAME_03304 [Necator americanus]|uniref:Uncharacterized protein n=1 Tax=Necator americanus TaxID=51031 RepID=W2T4D0_NECAM|nr:hypothetical protein NECAME_03304 [Necator americanus]ETN76875.1 hypothetical protein NECAME_03304 [Necator americanus]
MHFYGSVIALRKPMTSTLGTISSASKTMLDELSDSGKAKIPVDVCTQLTAEFVPAVKEISKAGTELLRVYQALEKSSALYVHALEALVKSSKKAFPGAKTHANGLNELVAQYKQTLDQHKRSVSLSSFFNKIICIFEMVRSSHIFFPY